jgi:hypothetical protein
LLQKGEQGRVARKPSSISGRRIMRSLLMANECILEELPLFDNDSREKLLKVGLFAA